MTSAILPEDFDLDFKNIRSGYIRNCFLKTLVHFPELADYHILLKEKTIRRTTMQARPLFRRNFLLGKIEYMIAYDNQMALNRPYRLEDLREDVVMGWFAHELGHVMDYLGKGPLEMFWYGCRYLLSKGFHAQVERRADEYAVERGLFDYLIATKKFLLEEANLPERYLTRLVKYYYSPEELEQVAQRLGNF